jgi:hypothetical protein
LEAKRLIGPKRRPEEMKAGETVTSASGSGPYRELILPALAN